MTWKERSTTHEVVPVLENAQVKALKNYYQ